jgi:hypothetical protein
MLPPWFQNRVQGKLSSLPAKAGRTPNRIKRENLSLGDKDLQTRLRFEILGHFEIGRRLIHDRLAAEVDLQLGHRG